MKITLISQKQSNLNYGQTPVYIFKYDLNKLYTLSKIQKVINLKINKIPNCQNKLYMINCKFIGMNSNNGWMLTKTLSFLETKKLEDAYNFIIDSFVRQEELKARYIEIYVRNKKIESQRAGKDDKNDCIYNAILKSYNYKKDLLPSTIRSAKLLKKRLNIERTDKIPFDRIPEIEVLLKASITITGDYTYQSKFIQKYHINLKCKDEHIELVKQKDSINTCMQFKPVTKDNIYTIYFKDTNVLLYDGITTQSITIDEYKLLQYDKKKLLVKVNNEEDLKVFRQNYFIKADTLIEQTNGFINYYKSQYDSKIAFYLFRNMSQSIPEPVQLDVLEHHILDDAFRGGIHYAQIGEYKNCFDYDMNSMYSYYMKQLNFIFPSTKPTYTTFTIDEFNNLKFYNFGLYRVSFDLDENNKLHKLWTITTKLSWYTQHDLNAAKELKIKINIEENVTNALLYHSKDCLRGNKTFETYINYIDNLEKKNVDSKKYLKPIRNALWGCLTEKNKKIHIVTQSETFDLSDYHLESIVDNENSTVIKTIDKHEIFKYSWARCGIFLTSYCRLHMIKILLKCNIDDIVYINTDGFVSKSEIVELKISNNMGDFKIKQKGFCIVKNKSVVIWS